MTSKVFVIHGQDNVYAHPRLQNRIDYCPWMTFQLPAISIYLEPEIFSSCIACKIDNLLASLIFCCSSMDKRRYCVEHIFFNLFIISSLCIPSFKDCWRVHYTSVHINESIGLKKPIFLRPAIRMHSLKTITYRY